MKNKYTTTVELPKVTIVFNKEGYIHLHYKNHELNLEDNQQIFQVVRKNSPWDKCPFLISGDEIANLDKESKAFNTSPEVTKHMSAQAFIIKNTAQRLAVNFFIIVFKPKVPFKVFTHQALAVEWLLSFKAQTEPAKKEILGELV